MAKALSIYLPRWPARLAMRRLRRPCENPRDGDPPDPPPAILLVDTARGVQTIACCCERAAGQGVRIGMTLAHARAILKETRVWIEDSRHVEDAAALRRFARWMLRFAPVVAPDLPDGLLLDISGCRRLFGGVDAHVRAVAAALARLKLPARLAAAPTVGCAWAMARFGTGSRIVENRESIRAALAPLPVAALRIEMGTVRALADVGIQRIGHVLDIPRAELASRFGAGLLRRIDQAFGDVEELIEPITPGRPLEARRAFDGPVKRIEAIEQTLQGLLAALLADARQRDCGIRAMQIDLCRIDVPPVHESITLSYPTRDEVHLWRMMQPRIERLHLGYGVETVTLRATAAERLRPVQASLGSDWTLLPSGESRMAEDGAQALGVLLDQLVERIGRQGVTRVRPVASHLPEGAFLRMDAGEDIRPGGRGDAPVAYTGASRDARRATPAGRRAAASGPAPIYHAERPSCLYERPEPARVIALLPEGPPVWVQWRGAGGAVQQARGPERIATQWWQEPGGQRDYFEVQDETGRWLWMFRADETGEWFVHGEWV